MPASDAPPERAAAPGVGPGTDVADSGRDALGVSDDASSDARGAEAAGDGRLDGMAADAADVPVDARDAAAAYDPCPAQGTACAIMPLGDSITDGVGSSGGGYRPPLFHLANADHKLITFVGTAMNGPTTVDGVPFPRRHEGHSGYTIEHGGPDDRGGLASDINLVDVIKTTRPNVVTLMIGTNDVGTSFDLPNAPQRLGRLMDMILDADPRLLLVVAQIVPTTSDADNVKVRAFNAAIPGLVTSRVSAGKHVAWVDMYGAFTANPSFKTAYMNDGLHPRDAGYAVMASTWYAALGAFLR